MRKTKRMGEWFQIIIPPTWKGKTVFELFRIEWEVPRKLIHNYRITNKVLINGIECDWNAPLNDGDKLLIKLFAEEESKIQPYFYELDILFEDDHLLVVNKPPFMKTHPNDSKKEQETLLNAVAYHMLETGQMRNIHQIHRLDRDTTGAILFAKHDLASAILAVMLDKRKIKRTYLALTHGIFPKKKGTINQPIGRDRHHPTKRRVSQSGKHAVTHYQVIKEDKQRNLSYIKCSLETGRTHQIRVHLSSIGHPLVGDTLYGGKPDANRQALHAVKLELPHPFTGESVICLAPFKDNPTIFQSLDIHSL
ncbi:RluA family pseudouridine synthase [Bacillus rubiinfantis]|uniref:RluA family pseudouridine synthase n=1 Tax=Bacillus rubiinfantis TaxID=1499680 RepID=UPI0005AAC86F|nr:RluA family pseudouridine synthase [Bacillus rubiinfantis]